MSASTIGYGPAWSSDTPPIPENNPMLHGIFNVDDPLPAMLRRSDELIAAASRLIPAGAVYEALVAQDDLLCRHILCTRARGFAGLVARLEHLITLLDQHEDVSEFVLDVAAAALADAEALAAAS